MLRDTVGEVSGVIVLDVTGLDSNALALCGGTYIKRG